MIKLSFPTNRAIAISYYGPNGPDEHGSGHRLDFRDIYYRLDLQDMFRWYFSRFYVRGQQ